MATQSEAISAALEAATWAPSVHNSQPWTCAVAGEEIGARADADRKLRAGDPAGREMLIGCGAALFNIRTVLRIRVIAALTQAAQAAAPKDVGTGPAAPRDVVEH